jgi:hypothetical protein
MIGLSWRWAGSAAGCLGLALVLSGPALAKAPPEQHGSTAFRAVLDCRALSDNAARLACFDAATAKMGEAESHGDIVVVDRAQAAAAHREAFGLPIPSLSFLTRAMGSEEVDRLEGVVRSLRADAGGKWTFVLEDGSHWRQISGELLRDPKGGSKVVIHRGSLGSFLMNVDGQASIKVHREL